MDPRSQDTPSDNSSTASATSPTPTPTPSTPTPAPTQPAPSGGLPPLPTGKRKPVQDKSHVWDHFEKYDDVTEFTKEDGTKGQIIKKRVRCKYCTAHYVVDPSVNGISTFNKHIEHQCKAYPGRLQDKRQKALSFDQTVGNLVARGCSKDDCLKACVEMVIIEELPFSFVEGRGFRRFCSVACPIFQVPSCRTLVRHFLALYDEMKDNLKNDLASHRVCLTIDTWTSCQNINYMVITAHFIDSEWNLHKRVLNFRVIANHKGNSIGKLLEQCLLEWGVEKVMTITADNATTNTRAIEYLKGKMKHWTNAKMVLGGKYLHVRCCAHIVNLIVGEGLKKLEKSILAIRNAVKYVRSSPRRLADFKDCVTRERIPCKGLVVLDVPTRWNSTYLMLDAALKFEKAFERLGEDEENNSYLSWFGEEEEGVSNPRKRVGPPKGNDWNNATVFVNFLKVFYDMTLKMSLSLQPAVHETFHDLISIEEEIKCLFRDEDMPFGDDDLDESEAQMVLNDMTDGMKKKFEMYWGDLDKINQFLLVALVLDPRYKLGNLAHVLQKYCLDAESATKKKEEIKAILIKMFDEYAAPKPQSEGSSISGVTGPTTSISSTTSTRKSSWELRVGRIRQEMTRQWMEEVAASSVVVLEHEVDRYIKDPIERVDPDSDFDILKWWKHNGVNYPVLALIAKDILAIPVSTVASEACFSTGGRVVNPFHASLTPKMVEALICCQNWLKSEDISSLQYEPSIEEMEFYEALEAEYMSSATLKKTAPAVQC